jgi:hypothetical protein
MTSQSPRIYTYKITFEEVPYYYYGVKKEEYYNQEYWGSPKTNKWCWELYTPKKQILELFDFTDEGWLEANKVEQRLIKPVFNNDKWCLNACCAGTFSIKQARIAGKKGAKKQYEEKIGMHGRTQEQMIEDGKKGGYRTYELGVGIYGLTEEQRSENSKKSGKIGGNRVKELNVGIFALTPEQRSENSKKSGKIGGNKAKELNVGIFALTPEQLRENGKKADEFNRKNKIGFYAIKPEQRREAMLKTNSQRWMCEETGFITSPGALSTYQKARGIDTSKRRRIS